MNFGDRMIPFVGYKMIPFRCWIRLLLQVNAEDGDVFMDPRACCLSPNLPAGFHETGAMLLGHAAAAAAAGIYGPVAPLLYPSPAVMIERLGPHILRSHVSTVQYKSIPNSKCL